MAKQLKKDAHTVITVAISRLKPSFGVPRHQCTPASKPWFSVGNTSPTTETLFGSTRLSTGRSEPKKPLVAIR